MKSEHRHELKTNELAEWIANLPQWARENRLTIIYVAVLIVVVAGYSVWYYYKKNVVALNRQYQLTNLIRQLDQNKPQIIRAQTQGFDTSYNLLQIADSLRGFSQEEQNTKMTALALIKQAEALRTELHYRKESIRDQDLVDQVNRAKDTYNRAIEMTSDNPSLLAAAKFGLGLCEEELGNGEQAAKIYNDISDDPSLNFTTSAAAAKRRLSLIDDYQQKIVFKEAPKTARETPSSAPPQTPFQQPQDINMITQ